jgi:hypothetical protein
MRIGFKTSPSNVCAAALADALRRVVHETAEPLREGRG